MGQTGYSRGTKSLDPMEQADVVCINSGLPPPFFFVIDISKMTASAPHTLPKSPAHIANAPEGYMFHARIYPGLQTPVAMGSPYEGKGKGHVAKETSTFTKGQPMYNSAKDPAQVRTTGMESFQ
jgi:hypothetical protein